MASMGAVLLDRFINEDDELIIRAQDQRSGMTFNVELPNQRDGVREFAGSFGGGASLPLRKEGDRFILDVDPNEMSEEEFEEFDRRLAIQAAREVVAPSLSDEAIGDVLDQPMSQNQKTEELRRLESEAIPDEEVPVPAGP